MFYIENKNIIKYILFTIVVLSLINFLPMEKLSNLQMFLIITPIVGLYIIFDTFICINNNNTIISRKEKFENFTETQKNSAESSAKSSGESTAKSTAKSSISPALDTP